MLPYIYFMDRAIPMYGLCIVAGVLLASVLMVIRCEKENSCWENAIIIGITGLGVGLIGAKVAYLVVTFSCSEIVNLIKEGKWQFILNGGFIFYGGLIGGVFGALLGGRIAKSRIFLYEKHLVPVIPLVHCFGRIGCLCAGCCYGRPVEYGFSVVYTHPIGGAPIGKPLMPIQLYEAIYNLVIFAFLRYLNNKNKSIVILPCYLFLYAVGRFVLEFFRYDYVRGVYCGISTSQLISVAMMIISVILFIVRCRKKGAIT